MSYPGDDILLPDEPAPAIAPLDTGIDYSTKRGSTVICEMITRYWSDRGVKGAIAYPVRKVASKNDARYEVGSNIRLQRVPGGWKAVTA